MEYERLLPPLVSNKATTTTLELGNSNTTFRQQMVSLKVEETGRDRRYYNEIADQEHTVFVHNDVNSGPLIAVMTSVNPKAADKSKLLIRTRSVRSFI